MNNPIKVWLFSSCCSCWIQQVLHVHRSLNCNNNLRRFNYIHILSTCQLYKLVNKNNILPIGHIHIWRRDQPRKSLSAPSPNAQALKVLETSTSPWSQQLTFFVKLIAHLFVFHKMLLVSIKHWVIILPIHNAWWWYWIPA